MKRFAMRSVGPSLRSILWLSSLAMLFAWQRWINAAPGPEITLHKAVQPASVSAGGRVTYTIVLCNAGGEPARELAVADSLPAGFSYISGSTRIRLNGALLSTRDPSIAGGVITWRSLPLPAARQGSYYGIHIFVQDRCHSDDINYQLDRALELMGPGAYVKQLFYGITPQTQGPLPCWVDFVSRAYDRGLIPVVRLQGDHDGPTWRKPQPDSPGDYTSIARAFQRVVQGLPRREGRPLYVEIWNEPNLGIEWSGAPNPTEYAKFLVDVAAAIRALGDPHIRILNGALSPGGEYDRLAFIDGMAAVPGALAAFDVWAAHPYPGNHPPEYNLHDGTATYRHAAIDSYLLELERLAAHGRTGLQVLLTETGYALEQGDFAFEGYPPINEGLRADYIKRAFRDYWRYWPEVLGVCPYELVDPHGEWWAWDWLYPDGRRHWQYDSMATLAKETPLIPSELEIVFQARVASASGAYANRVSATAGNATIPPLERAALVTVLQPTATPTATARPPTTAIYTGTPPTPIVTPFCFDLVREGSFERDDAWELNRAAYARKLVHQGARSLELGIVDGPNAYSFSSARQTLIIPDEATGTRLGFWYYPLSADSESDLQIARVLDRDGNLLESILREASDAREWLYREYDLSAYAGQAVQLYFAVRNDGQGGTTAMYVDDVSLWACGPGLSTPTATASPSLTATASPTATALSTPTPDCREQISNPGFEYVGGWELHSDLISAQYTDALAYEGRRSLLLGMTEEAEAEGFSSAWQLVAVPADASRITLSFRCYPISDDSGNDRQLALILSEAHFPLEIVMSSRSDVQTWLSFGHSLDRYAGQRIKVYFGVYNDGRGGRTAMYVDEVSLQACWEAPAATPSPSPYRSWLPLVLKPSSETALDNTFPQ